MANPASSISCMPRSCFSLSCPDQRIKEITACVTLILLGTLFLGLTLGGAFHNIGSAKFILNPDAFVGITASLSAFTAFCIGLLTKHCANRHPSSPFLPEETIPASSPPPAIVVVPGQTEIVFKTPQRTRERMAELKAESAEDVRKLTEVQLELQSTRRDLRAAQEEIVRLKGLSESTPAKAAPSPPPRPAKRQGQ